MSEETADFEATAGNDPIKVDLDGLIISAANKQAERDELDKHIEDFLASGGKISQIEPNILADPPKKPTSNYGSQPI